MDGPAHFGAGAAARQALDAGIIGGRRIFKTVVI
jgi:hypothetical protein